MAINAPVQATIISPDDVSDFVLNQHYNWVWGDREHVMPPTHDEIWEAGRTAFSSNPRCVTFMVAINGDHKQIDFIEGRITGVQYESAATGMLMIRMETDDKRWTKIHGFYNCHGGGRVGGCLSITPRRSRG